jgi:hypothetical protein
MEASVAETAIGAHVHRFRVDPPDGPTSTGRCDCGETRDFRNSADEAPGTPWHGKTAAIA